MYKNANKYFSRNRGLVRAVTFNTGQTSNYKLCPSCNEKVPKDEFRTHLLQIHPGEIFIKCGYCFRIIGVNSLKDFYSKHLSKGHHNYPWSSGEKKDSDFKVYAWGAKELPPTTKLNYSSYRSDTSTQDKRFTIKLLIRKS